MTDRVTTISEAEIDRKIDSKVFDSHSSLAKSVSGFGADLKKGLEEINKHTTQLDVMQYKIDSNNKISENGLSDIDKKLELGFKDVNDKLAEFVTKDQFWPVKTIVFGCLGLILTYVVLQGLPSIIKGVTSQSHATEQIANEKK